MREIKFERLMEVSIALTSEKDGDRLLNRILQECMSITGCDGGTLYICVPEGLQFKIMITRSMDYYRGAGFDEPVTLPPVAMARSHVCACCAMDRRLINLEDVYLSDSYDFGGARKYDAMTGYRTQSMLVVPMENDRSEIIGVLQLLNAKDEGGATVPFDPAYERIISSLTSLAAISLTNSNYAREIVETLDSFVRVMVDAVDARSPYNANHTRNMVAYGERFIDWLDHNTDWHFTDAARRQLLMSIWLHDVGKLVIPLEVMDKATRLADQITEIRHRFREIGLLARIDYLEGRGTQAEYDAVSAALAEGLRLVESANTAGFLPDDTLAAIRALAARTYRDEAGEHPWLTAEEAYSLSIRKGTLTPEERATMEKHASMTARMLGKMKFSRDYAMVPEWAAAHHEYPNGSGYPNHLSDGQISREVRLITILDVFDALTARDRPYKKPMPDEKALAILADMAKDGQIDQPLLDQFVESRAWDER